MFRLIRPQATDGVPQIALDGDGYVSARTALARYRSAPAGYFGVGRLDHEGTLAEVILDRICGADGDCPRPATVVHASTYHRLCETCAAGLEVLTVPELARLLGIACRLAPVLARSGPPAAGGEPAGPANRIASEFAGRLADPIWRLELCAELEQTPAAINGLLIGVGALTHREVLDLYAELRTLADELPGRVREELISMIGRPLSPAGVAARRMGMQG